MPRDGQEQYPVEAEQMGAVECFLYYEARLMDEHRYEEWEALWTDDGVYWVPAFHDSEDPDRQVSLIYDTRAGIAARVKRLAGSHAYAQQPKTRLLRTVSNIEAYSIPDQGLRVESNFVLSAQRRDSVAMWSGRARHLLRVGRNGSWTDWRIARKTVRLVPLELPLSNLSFLL